MAVKTSLELAQLLFASEFDASLAGLEGESCFVVVFGALGLALGGLCDSMLDDKSV